MANRLCIIPLRTVEAVAKTHDSGRCVVLVDEYDKPIIEYLNDLPRARANRDMLRPFYGVLKDAAPFIEFVFVTGVSAFGKVSLFSDLNNIRQLTLDSLAHTIVGLTEAELTEYYPEQIAATGLSREEIKYWYNGYTWGGERVYNPWSILHLLSSKKRDNYWAGSGTPKFVTDVLAREGAHDLEGSRLDKTELTSFSLDHLDAVSILWQGGYLTFDDAEPRGDRYTLRYPNEEVRRTFFGVLLTSYGFNRANPTRQANALEDALLARDLETFAEQVDAILAAVPYQLWQDASERFYHAVLLTAFRYIGTFEIQAEVSSARGRADVVLLTERYVYAIEFKLLRPTAAQAEEEAARKAAAEALVDEALAQIAARGYLDAHRGGGAGDNCAGRGLRCRAAQGGGLAGGLRSRGVRLSAKPHAAASVTFRVRAYVVCLRKYPIRFRTAISYVSREAVGRAEYPRLPVLIACHQGLLSTEPGTNS